MKNILRNGVIVLLFSTLGLSSSAYSQFISQTLNTIYAAVTCADKSEIITAATNRVRNMFSNEMISAWITLSEDCSSHEDVLKAIFLSKLTYTVYDNRHPRIGFMDAANKTKDDLVGALNAHQDLASKALQSVISEFKPETFQKIHGSFTIGNPSGLWQFLKPSGKVNAFIVDDRDTTYIAIRGSKSKEDWCVNLTAKHTQGGVHEGFRTYSSKLLELLREKPIQSNIILTGHSLGGAVAEVTARSMPGSKVISFGAPRQGDKIYADSQQNVEAYLNASDILNFLTPGVFSKRHIFFGTDFDHDIADYHRAQVVSGPVLGHDISRVYFKFVISALAKDPKWGG